MLSASIALVGCCFFQNALTAGMGETVSLAVTTVKIRTALHRATSPLVRVTVGKDLHPAFVTSLKVGVFFK